MDTVVCICTQIQYLSKSMFASSFCFVLLSWLISLSYCVILGSSLFLFENYSYNLFLCLDSSSFSFSSHRIHTVELLRSHRLSLTPDPGRRGLLGLLQDKGWSTTETARHKRGTLLLTLVSSHLFFSHTWTDPHIQGRTIPFTWNFLATLYSL